MFNYSATKTTGSKSWVLQRITGIILVVFTIGHYILMHYQPDNGKTFEAVLGRMQSPWYRLIDLVFVTFAMYHGLNGVWNIFRDFKLKYWAKVTLLTLLIVFGLAFLLWGYHIIFSIPYVK